MSRTYSENKVKYFSRMQEYLGEYRRMLFVGVDNVQSQQMHNIRRSLRGKAEILMGKNTLMRKVITAAAAGGDTRIAALLQKVVNDNKLVGNIGIIFTNDDFGDILTCIRTNRIQAPARVGAISPVDVTIPAGNTGLEPGMTSFFQALLINTKIVKGAVEIVADKQVLKVGDKVDNSTAVLLQKLNIKPFFYGLEIQFVFDDGDVYGADVLNMKDDVIEAQIRGALNNVTALSLALDIPTEPSLPHFVMTAFKNLLSVSLGTDYSFPEFNAKEIVDAVKSGKSIGAAAPAAAAAAPAAAAAAGGKKAPEPEPEEDEDMGLGLFD